jgi:hypothetical protein
LEIVPIKFLFLEFKLLISKLKESFGVFDIVCNFLNADDSRKESRPSSVKEKKLIKFLLSVGSISKCAGVRLLSYILF